MADGAEAGLQIEVLNRRLAEVWQRIERAGGSRETVTLVAVTKTFPIEYVQAALTVGLDDIGENYAQDLAEKDDQAKALGLRPRWHFIGGLQRNKVKLLAGRVALWQTVDRLALVDEIAKRDPGARVLIQVNTTDEAQKSGCQPSEARSLVEHGRDCGLIVEGLMTIGPTGPGGTGGDPRPAFDSLHDLADACEVDQLSMGMTADFELAVAAGSTMVRIGSALFGPRTTGR
ncbi:MAG: YggS family pyridoxal phosphate-dependent enzyme [Acidimicrobiales bacterium]